MKNCKKVNLCFYPRPPHPPHKMWHYILGLMFEVEQMRHPVPLFRALHQWLHYDKRTQNICALVLKLKLNYQSKLTIYSIIIKTLNTTWYTHSLTMLWITCHQHFEIFISKTLFNHSTISLFKILNQT